jgi:hypothetical protein
LIHLQQFLQTPLGSEARALFGGTMPPKKAKGKGKEPEAEKLAEEDEKAKAYGDDATLLAELKKRGVPVPEKPLPDQG